MYCSKKTQTIFFSTEKMIILFFRKYGLKVALEGKLTSIMQQSFQLVDYEHLYRSTEQRDRDGHRPLISNNFGNLTTIRAIEDLVLYHPLFGNFICYAFIH